MRIKFIETLPRPRRRRFVRIPLQWWAVCMLLAAVGFVAILVCALLALKGGVP